MTRKPSSPNLQLTQDYALFEPHPYNRDVTRTKILEASMRQYGFDPGLPIRVVVNGNGKFRITHGHHRFHVARKLGIPFWYVVVANDIPLFESEASTHAWDTEDYTRARARGGEPGAEAVLRYRDRTGIPINSCISLVGGESASSGNKAKEMKIGTFKVGDNQHADQVAEIILHCKDHGVSFATSNYFVKAVSKCLFVPEFDADLFMHKVATHAELMTPRRGVNDYLELMELIYNRQSQQKFPLAFFARETAAERQATFGRKCRASATAAGHTKLTQATAQG